jgi:hypothetical protein
VEPSGFVWEPKVIATGGDFVLLRVSIGHHYAMVCPTLHEYYVYRAGGSTGGPPSLELLRQGGICSNSPPPARTSRLLEDIFGGLEAQIRPR